MSKEIGLNTVVASATSFTESAFDNKTTYVNGNEVASNYDQCDYNLLFSHLPASFAHLSQIQLNQITFTSHQPNTVSTIQFSDQHGVQKLCYALVALCFGLFYSLIGYRFLKLSAFIIGFALGSSVIYLILAEQKQLTVIENLIISLSIGCLFAFVALLVQYIGLFLLGITSSISIVTCILILIDLFHTNNSAWLCILLMFTCATVVASITLKFQKSLTIFNTSAIGAGLLLFSVDYFVENNLLLDYIFELYKVNGNSFNIFERQKALLKATSNGESNDSTRFSSFSTKRIVQASTLTNSFPKSLNNFTSITNKLNSSVTESGNSNSALGLFMHLYSSAHARLCWYTWLIFGTYFGLLISSILVQYLITGKKYDHRDSWQKLIRGSRKKRSANLEKIRLKSHVNSQEHSSSSNHHNNHRSSSKNQSCPAQNATFDSSTSAANTDGLSLSEQSFDSQNDTLLLVTNEVKATHPNHGASSKNSCVLPNKKSKRKERVVNVSQSTDVRSSFEGMNHKKDSKESRKRSKSKNTATFQREKFPSNNAKSKENSNSTTASTSSSASSSCQLLQTQMAVKPSAPPAPSLSSTSAFSSSNFGSNQLPPPVPSQPPPKLPHIFTTSSSTSSSTPSGMANSNSVSLGENNAIIQQILSPHQNISKIKQHRSGSSKKESEKFRHFYQIRRNNGDVLSQDFMNNIQNKIQPSLNNDTKKSN